MAFTQYLSKKVLDHTFGKATFTAPTNIFVGLSSTLPAADGSNITEPTGGNYARVSTAATDWTTASLASPSLISNGNAVTFGQASADWLTGANIGYAFLADAITSGNVLAVCTLSVAKPVLNTDTAQFAVGQIAFTLD